MHEAAHGPVVGDHVTGAMNQFANRHVFQGNVGCVCFYYCHWICTVLLSLRSLAVWDNTDCQK